MGKTSVIVFGLAAVLTLGVLVAAFTSGPFSWFFPLTTEVKFHPPLAEDVSWLTERAAKQHQAARGMKARADLRFRHWQPQSGITFRHRIVDEGGPAIMANHYDHGNGIAAADVDGDGFPDLYFVNQVGANQLWRNRGDGTFAHAEAAGDIAVRDAVSVSASFADIDNDGDPDLYVTTVMGGNRLFINDGTGRFKEVSENSGLHFLGHSSGATFFDFDRDGRLDLFLSNVGVYTSDKTRVAFRDWTTGPDRTAYICRTGFDRAFLLHRDRKFDEASRLFRNMGSHWFEDVTSRLGIAGEGWSGDATALDANEDGWPDLYVLNMQGNDTYFENAAGRRFVAKREAPFGSTPQGSMGVKVFDFDGDARLDLYVTDMHSDMYARAEPGEEALKSDVLHKNLSEREGLFEGDGSGRIFGNALYRNLGQGRFDESSDRVGAETYWPWGISVGDLNADGFDDVFVTASMNYPYRYQTNHVLINDAGRRLVDLAIPLGAEPRPDWQGHARPWFGLDCWGKDAEHRHCRDRKRSWNRYVMVMAPRGSRSSVILDIDNDGDLDVVTNEFNDHPLVLRSDLAERRNVNWLKVRLRGTASNRDGLGALVEVQVAQRRLVKVHDGKSGYLSQSSLPLYFGLADASHVDRITVRWPSGAVQVLEGPLAGARELVIEEDG